MRSNKINKKIKNTSFHTRSGNESLVYVRGGLETQRFETEARRDFGVLIPRRDTRLYISCTNLSQGWESESKVGIAFFWLEKQFFKSC